MSMVTKVTSLTISKFPVKMAATTKKTLNIEGDENRVWIDMLDSLTDFISASRTMIRIMNNKLIGNGLNKSTNSFPDLSRVLSLPDETIKEIHVNSTFSRVNPTTNYANFKQEPFARHHSASHFLDEQYNLTKQTIARRLRPQNRLATSSNSRNTLIKDYILNDTFTEGLYRMNSPKVRPLQLERYADACQTGPRFTARENTLHNNSYDV